MAYKQQHTPKSQPKQSIEQRNDPERDRWRNYGQGSFGSDESYQQDFNNFSSRNRSRSAADWDYSEAPSGPRH